MIHNFTYNNTIRGGGGVPLAAQSICMLLYGIDWVIIYLRFIKSVSKCVDIVNVKITVSLQGIYVFVLYISLNLSLEKYELLFKNIHLLFYLLSVQILTNKTTEFFLTISWVHFKN